MKVKTALQIGALFPIFLAILVCIILVVRSRHIRELNETISLTEGLVTEVANLNLATHKWVLTGTHEVQAFWKKHYEAIGRILGTIKPDEFIEQLRLNSLRDAYRQAGEDFTALVGIKDAKPQAERFTLSPKEQALIDDLLIQIREMITSCSALASASLSATEASQSETDTTIAIWFGIISLIIAACLLVAARRVIQRFESVRDGIGALAERKADRKIEAQSGDELGELLQAFDHISRQLNESQQVLKKEAAEHQTAAESLRKANIILADALVKLKRAQDQVVDSTRINAFSQVALGIQHSFNNTLTPILGLSDYLLTYPDTLKDHEALVEHLKTINTSMKRAREEIDQLVDFFRPGKQLNTVSTDLNELVRRTVMNSKRIWTDVQRTRGVQIQVNTSLGEIPQVQTDQTAMCEVLACLLTNSVDAMPRGGKIDISTRIEKDKVLLAVADDGDGMSDEVRSRCLEPFFSTKGSDATGMGLTAVAAIVRRHKGSLNIESALGTGTTVTISLPAHASSAPQESHRKETQTVQSCNVLIVDDEPWVRSLCSTVLKAAGHAVETAVDGADGLRKFQAAHFDVAIVDMAMPTMSGQELAKAMREQAPGTKIILLTGFGEVLLKEGAKPDCVDMILGKPVSVDDLRAAVAGLTSGKKE